MMIKRTLLCALFILCALFLSSCSSKQPTPDKNNNPTSSNDPAITPVKPSLSFYETDAKDEQWVKQMVATYASPKQQAIDKLSIAIVNFPSAQVLGEFCPQNGSGCAMACEMDKVDKECINYLTGKQLNVQYILALADIKQTDYQYQTLAHELGHILDHAYLDQKELKTLHLQLNKNGNNCYMDELNECVSDTEVLADQISRCSGEQKLGRKTELEWSHYLVKDLNKGNFCQVFYKALGTTASKS